MADGYIGSHESAENQLHGRIIWGKDIEELLSPLSCSSSTTVAPTNHSNLYSNYSHSMASIKPTKHHTVKEDKMAKSIAHQSMTFFAVLLIVCKYIIFIFFFPR